MKHWRDFFALTWMTGTDGRIAFWKVGTMLLIAFLFGLSLGAFREGGLVAAMPSLIAFAIALLFGLHSIQGLKTWAREKPGPQVTANTNVTADLAALAKEVLARRDNDKDAEATP